MLSLNLYGLFLSAAILIDCILIACCLNRYKIEYYKFLPLSFANFFSVLAGGKILGAIQSGSSIETAPMSSMGGFAASIAVVIGLGLLMKIKLNHLIKSVALPLPLTYSISKLGCASAGCCYGIPYDGAGCIYNAVHNKGVGVFPVQLTETAVFFVIFAVFFIIYKRNKFSLITSLGLLLACCAAKGSLFYLRNESLSEPFGSHQIIICSTAIIIITVAVIYISVNKHKEKARKEITNAK